MATAWTLLEPHRSIFSTLPRLGSIYGSATDHPFYDMHPALQPLADAFIADLRRIITLDELGHPAPYIPGLGSFDMNEVYHLIDEIDHRWKKEAYLQPSHHIDNKPQETNPYPLGLLPTPFCLAVAQHRRLRLMQFGFYKETWEQETWSIYQIPEEEERP